MKLTPRQRIGLWILGIVAVLFVAGIYYIAFAALTWPD